MWESFADGVLKEMLEVRAYQSCRNFSDELARPLCQTDRQTELREASNFAKVTQQVDGRVRTQPQDACFLFTLHFSLCSYF